MSGNRSIGENERKPLSLLAPVPLCLTNFVAKPAHTSRLFQPIFEIKS